MSIACSEPGILTSTGSSPLLRKSAESNALRLIPLGGTGEFGMNMMCYEIGDERILIDCGSMWPEPDMLGIDVVIPDISYLLDEPEKLQGILLTHGHEDHIGAVPYVLGKLRVPVYATRLTMGILKAKLEEHDLPYSVEYVQLDYRRPVRIGKQFEVTPIHVTHSIPDSAAFAVRTAPGTVIHTGDYKIDYAPLNGEPFDFYTFSRLGEEGVLALVADSTNAGSAGSTHTERWLKRHLEPIIAASEGAVFCATFSSSLHRMQLVMEIARRHGRKVFTAGRSLQRNFAVASELGYLKIPFENLYPLRDIDSVPPRERLILATGSQGEPLSVMSRLALGEFKPVEVAPGDTVIISSRIIPGNERAIYRMINHFCRRGARVFDASSATVHVSGHAQQEEIKTLISITRPHFLIPVHGEIRQLQIHSQLAEGMGFDAESIALLENGDILELHPHTARKIGKVPVGRVLVDGKTVGETGEVVLRDRQHLSEDGMLIAILNVDRATGQLISDPEIVTRGFVYVDESEDLIEEFRTLVRETFDACAEETREESEVLNAEIRRALRKHIRRTYDRYPLILPVVQEI